eukprot:4285049-Karenia_brevis.AAC.1
MYWFEIPPIGDRHGSSIRRIASVRGLPGHGERFVSRVMASDVVRLTMCQETWNRFQIRHRVRH